MPTTDAKLKKEFERVRAKLRTLIKKFGTKKNMKQLGELASSLIVRRTRVGKGFEIRSKKDDYKTPGPLKALSESYILFRKKNKAKIKKPGTIKKSNLTFTGQMLDSIGVTTVSRGRVFIGATTEKRTGDKSTNSEIIQAQEEMGRVFLQLSNNQFRGLLRFFEKLIKDQIRVSIFRP